MLSLVALSVLPLALCHDNGMDMTMDGPMDLSMGQMLMYLHFTSGDNVLFFGWVPKSAGSMVGTCIGLFLLAMLDRWLAACMAMMSAHWSKRAQVVQEDKRSSRGLPVASLPAEPSRKDSFASESDVPPPAPAAPSIHPITLRNAPPFILSHDIVRGIMYAGHVALQFAFMLIVMTFQVGFILSIVVGLGVGETLFGRFASHATHIA